MDRVSTQPFLMNMVNIMISFKLIVALLCVVFSIHRSKGFFKLIEEFNGFDSYTLQLSCPSDLKVQTFYLLYAVLIETYYFVISVNYSLLSVSILVSWTLISVATMLMMIQYAVFVRILRERYKWANYIFACNIKDSWACPQLMYPNEITSLYNELRLLTEEVKNYYALHAILVITDSVLIFTACVTAMTLNYTNKSSKSLFADNLFLIYCLSKLLFVFFIVRETHNTMQEANKTVLIAHEALSITTNTVVMKEFEVLIMTCWNHPIVFDVYDFFNLDYKLLQSSTNFQYKNTAVTPVRLSTTTPMCSLHACTLYSLVSVYTPILLQNNVYWKPPVAKLFDFPGNQLFQLMGSH
ncbi:7TM chemoreceptor [Cinara cedri]|uniref:Gustatory receptor n=1 Tax=Cinara cedri TaxID=506608 RepID=A0A5E4MKF9_9HEMI|nr:7TM chemoreceptor [Cinara cedri]